MAASGRQPRARRGRRRGVRRRRRRRWGKVALFVLYSSVKLTPSWMFSSVASSPRCGNAAGPRKRILYTHVAPAGGKPSVAVTTPSGGFVSTGSPLQCTTRARSTPSTPKNPLVMLRCNIPVFLTQCDQMTPPFNTVGLLACDTLSYRRRCTQCRTGQSVWSD
jgi:hypothetical protein